MIPLGWKYYPALKTLLPLACGIVLSRLLALPVGWLLAALALATAWLAIEIRRGGGNAIPAVPSIVLVSGALLYAVGPGSATTRLEGLHIADVEIIGRVVAESVHRKNRIEYVVDCDSLLYRNSSVRPGAKALLRLYDTATDLRELPAYGDRISVIVTLTVPAPPSMPGSFDYAGYLRSRGIEFICSAGRASSICTIRRNDLSAIERIVLPIRRSAREFAREMVGGEEGDIVRALLLGEREDIDPSTREAFVRTGTVHVLAVSGLHVGVIAIGLFVLVSWIPNRSAQPLIYALAIALYVAVAGDWPSILRAAIMAVAFMTARSS
jgi:competence protein ComEC